MLYIHIPTNTNMISVENERDSEREREPDVRFGRTSRRSKMLSQRSQPLGVYQYKGIRDISFNKF